MEKEKWIQNILNSHTGMTKVNPSGDLFSKIEAKIYSEKVSDLTVWFAAASLTVLLFINFSLIRNNSNQKDNNNVNIESTFIQDNQLY